MASGSATSPLPCGNDPLAPSAHATRRAALLEAGDSQAFGLAPGQHLDHDVVLYEGVEKVVECRTIIIAIRNDQVDVSRVGCATAVRADNVEGGARRRGGLEDLLQDEHLAASGMFNIYDDSDLGRIREIRSPFQVNGQLDYEVGANRPAPGLGEGNADLLN